MHSDSAPTRLATRTTTLPGRLVLGSGSQWRRMLLERLGMPFEVCSPEVDETPRTGESPQDLAIRLSRDKAQAVRERLFGAANRQQDRSWAVIGSDQVATLDGIHPMGKPGNFERARAQLMASSGRTVCFHAAWCLLTEQGMRDGCSTVEVDFRELTEREISNYLKAEEPFDCAGSARCEGLGITLLRSIRSDDPTALIGLPLIAVGEALRSAGFDPLAVGPA